MDKAGKAQKDNTRQCNGLTYVSESQCCFTDLDYSFVRKVYEQQQQLEPSSSTSRQQYLAGLTRSIGACETIEQLDKLVSSELPKMSVSSLALAMHTATFHIPVNLSADRSPSSRVNLKQFDLDLDNGSRSPYQGDPRARAAHPAGPPPPPRRDWMSQASVLNRRLLSRLAEVSVSAAVDVRVVSTAVHCVGYSRRGGPWGTGDNVALQRLLLLVQPSLLLASPGELSRLAHGLIYSGLKLSPAWLESYAKVVLGKMDGLSARGLSFSVALLAHQGFAPDEYWWACFLDQTRPKLLSMEPLELCNVMWAVRCWNLDPGDEWREQARQRVADRLDAFPSNSLASLIKSTVHVVPDVPFSLLAAMATRAAAAAPHMSARADCEVLSAYAALDFLPEQHVLAAHVSAIQPKLATCSPSQLSVLVTCLARMHFLPSSLWLHEWTSAARSQARGFPPDAIAATFAAFATWQVKPTRELTQDLFERAVSQARQGGFPPYFATRMLCALATLRLPPPRPLLRELLSVIGSEQMWQTNARAGVYSPAAARARPNHAARDAERSAAIMALAVANAFVLLPRLLSCYDLEQELKIASSKGAYVHDDDEDHDIDHDHDDHGGGDEEEEDTAVPDGAPTMAAPSFSNPRGPGASGARPASSGVTPSRPAPKPWRDREAEGPSGMPPGGVQRREIAAVAKLLLPPTTVWAVLQVLQARLDLMGEAKLGAILQACAFMQLYPGRTFLLQHVFAVSKRLPGLHPSEKASFSTLYLHLNKIRLNLLARKEQQK